MGGLWASSICVIKGQNFPIYQEVVEGFWKGLGQGPSGCEEVLQGREDEAEKTIKSRKPDLLFAIGNSSLKFLRAKFPWTPTIFAMVTAGEGTGYWTSLSSPPGGLSGVVIDIPIKTQIDFIKKVVPGVRRVGTLYSPGSLKWVEEIKKELQQQGLVLNAHAVQNPTEAMEVSSQFGSGELFWLLPDKGVMTLENRDALFKALRGQGLTLYAFSPIYLKGPDGADFSVSIDFNSHGQQAGFLAKKLLQNPTSILAIETPQTIRVYLKQGRSGLQGDFPEAVWVP